MTLIHCLRDSFLRLWYAQNYSYCKVGEYLALNRHEVLVAVDWSNRASEWQNKWRELL